MTALNLKRQFKWSLVSQAYSQGVNIGSQLLLLPLMITLWGAERYGAWLIISALPSYLSMADLGFAQISANDMTMRMARGDKDGTVVVNHTAWLFNAIISVTLIVAFGIFVLLFPIEATFNIVNVGESHIALATFLLGVLTLSSLAFGVVGAGMRSVGLLWLVVTTNTTSRLTEVLLLISCTYFGGGFLLAASVMLLNRVVVLAPILIWFYRRYPHLRPAVSKADLQMMRQMVVPSIAYMSYTLSYALNIQGVSLLVGIFLGPVAVVTVNAVRTFTRLGRAAASIVISSIEPIFAQLAGSDANNHGKKAFQYLVAASVLGSVIYAVGVILFGEQFLEWWTRGTVVHQGVLINLMLLAVVFEIGWYTLQTPFVSTNRHSIFALWLLILSVGSIFFLWLIITAWGIDAAGLVAAGLNFGMLVITIAISVQKRGQLINGR
jgi:O-antigen/teichoic acid export membrane protein